MARQRSARHPTTRLDFDPRELSRGFEKRLAALVERVQHEAPLVVLVTFAHQIRREQSDAERQRASELSLYYIPALTVEGLLDGFDEYNRVIREVAKRRETILIEGEDEIPGDELHFADSVHFTDKGSRLMASRVAGALGGNPLFRDLVTKTAARYEDAQP
jgi:hypothetical protein